MDENNVIVENAAGVDPVEDFDVEEPIVETSSQPSIFDKIADILGLFLGLLVTTSIVGVTLAFFLTFIPGIHFSLMHFLKCWAGVMTFPLMRGVIHTQF